MAITLEREVSLVQTGVASQPAPDHGEMLLVDPAQSSAQAQVVPYRHDAATPAELPDRFLLGNLRHPQLRLRAPLHLRVEREHEHITVWSDDLEEIGYGSYLTQAVEDFQQTVAELYLALKADENRLGPGMRDLWQRLQEIIQERP